MDMGRIGRWVFSVAAGLTLLVQLGAAAQAATTSAGGYQTCAIGEPAGAMHCWGAGNVGQLGDNYSSHRAAPVAVVTPITRWSSVASGENHSCGIVGNGAVYCWGYNNFGQLGDGTLVSRAVPVAVVGLGSGARQLALGTDHSCALMQTGRVNCWGNGANGRLGSGQVANQSTPSEVLTLTDAVAVGAGQGHTCATLADGTMKCWGLNGNGQLGDGTTTNRTTPVFVSIGVPVAAIAVASLHTCARSSDGAALCWGRNNIGQLGDGTLVQRLMPVGVSGLSAGVAALVAGGHHTCAQTGSSSLKCWGYNATGQLGNGTLVNASVPVDVISLAAPVGEIAAGAYHTCARSGGGNRVRCWGDALYGRIAVGNTLAGTPDYSTQPVTISGLPAPARQLTMRTATGCAVTTFGSASCWGRNNLRQLGAGTAIDHAGPRYVFGLQSGVGDIAIGDGHGCAVRTDGAVWCWGDNTYGQIGDQTTIPRDVAVQTVGITNAVQVATGLNFSCVRTATGAVWCWGQNADGQLGDGTTLNRTQPVAAVGLGSGVIDLALGDRHACAVRSDGGVRCWGYNNGGQLGDASVVSRSVPTPINDGFASYVAISAGTVHTCALTTTGQAKCWGGNTYGQLGDGSTITRATPAGVATLSSGVLQIAAGDFHACALLAGGTLRCWGRNNNYQIGDDTQINRLQPVAASNVAGSVTRVVLGAQATCVLRAGDSAQCWGANGNGQLGNGSITTPLRVPQEISRWLIGDLIFRDDFES